MRVLVAGDGASELHEAAVAHAFRTLGQEVEAFPWHRFFSGGRGVSYALRKAQNKFLMGPAVGRMNEELIKIATSFNPDIVFIYRGTHILPATLDRLAEQVPRAVLIGYNNDDPFGTGHPPWLWRHFLRCVPKYDLVLAYRHHNVDEFRKLGARRVSLLRSWFLPDQHRPVELTADHRARFACDIVFVGHFEADDRLSYLYELVKHGINLRVFGPEWKRALGLPWLDALQPIVPMRGDDYVRALCGAKIALCFLSRINRDTYTRRSFEIPATGTMMLSEYTHDLASLFQEGGEADFFRTPAELIDKVKLYLADSARRENVAAAGLRRVHKDGHDILSRMRQVLIWADEIRRQR